MDPAHIYWHAAAGLAASTPFAFVARHVVRAANPATVDEMRKDAA